MKTKVLENHLENVVFSSVYLKKVSPGSQRKAHSILEVWIDLVNRKKTLSVSFADLAKELDSSRSTLQHYFSGIEDLRETAFKYVRVLYQSHVVESVANLQDNDPKKIFETYFDQSVAWPKITPKYSFLWIEFLALSSKYKTRQDLNCEAVKAGLMRLSSVIEHGQAIGLFAKGSPEKKARLIQILITGLILSEATEGQSVFEGQVQAVREHCLFLIEKVEM